MKMSERRIWYFLVIFILAVILVLLCAFALRYIPAFNISQITVRGMDTVPESVRQELSGCYGVNRFMLDGKAVSAQIASSALIDQCILTFAWPAKLVVTLVPSGEDILLYDGQSYYLMKDSRPAALSQTDSEDYAGMLCTVTVSPSFISYLQRFGSPASFDSVLSLISRINQAESRLITGIKYDNNITDGFGQIVISLDPLNAELYVREQVSFQRLSDAVSVIQTCYENDPASGLAIRTERWDLYADALVRRSVD